jgi:hypothetical protein
MLDFDLQVSGCQKYIFFNIYSLIKAFFDRGLPSSLYQRESETETEIGV